MSGARPAPNRSGARPGTQKIDLLGMLGGFLRRIGKRDGAIEGLVSLAARPSCARKAHACAIGNRSNCRAPAQRFDQRQSCGRTLRLRNGNGRLSVSTGEGCMRSSVP